MQAKTGDLRLHKNELGRTELRNKTITEKENSINMLATGKHFTGSHLKRKRGSRSKTEVIWLFS